jgi:uncharacterized membrane protein
MEGRQQDRELLRAELLISYVLRYGVLLCLAIIGLGLAVRMFQPGSGELVGALTSGLTAGDYHPPTAVSALAAGAFGGSGDTLIACGLVLLIGLPIFRVGLTTFLFLRERDWAFVLITAVVFTVLISGVIFGKAL